MTLQTNMNTIQDKLKRMMEFQQSRQKKLSQLDENMASMRKEVNGANEMLD